jgi:hypothetical protein
MSGRILVESKSPKSQSIEAVKALLTWRKMPTVPMPATIELPGGVILVLGSKKDIYYTTTHNDCSCPARAFHPDKQCKHMARFATVEVHIPKAVHDMMPRGGLELMDKIGFKPCLE